MNLKYMLAIGALLFSSIASARTPAGVAAYNSSPPVQHSSIHGEYVPNVAAVKDDLRAAERGNASAQFKMALRYDSGQGVPQDLAESVKWLHKAAEQGFVKAQYNLGCIYDSGKGVPQNHAEAVKWLRKAALQGYTSAQKNLGAKYGNGNGVPQSYFDAYVWSVIAATSGDEGAMNNRNLSASKLSPEELEAANIRATKLHEEIERRKG
jgi:TPR repeat protein